jgi:hypothetical protein
LGEFNQQTALARASAGVKKFKHLRGLLLSHISTA